MIYLAAHQRARSGMGEIVSLKVRPLCGCGLTRLDLAGPEHGNCPGMWFCGTCRTVKPRSQFWLYPTGTPEARCKRCRQLRQNAKRRRQYRKDRAFRELIAARKKVYRAKDPAAEKKRRRIYYQAHREQILAAIHERYRTDQKYRTGKLLYSRAWHRKNRRRSES